MHGSGAHAQSSHLAARRRRLVLGSVGLAGAGGAQPAPDVTFGFTGAPEAWVVPEGICSIVVSAYGAQGGDHLYVDGPNGLGGRGGRATATLAVAPGDVLTVRVGGAGESIWRLGTAGGAGGWNGGGDGGSLEDVSPGAGGGGATDVSIDGTVVLVAGGGGGVGGWSVGEAEGGPFGDGGAGGGVVGGVGRAQLASPGGGGSATAPGEGGLNSDGAPSGQPGAPGQGGAGGDGVLRVYDGGGGGGGPPGGGPAHLRRLTGSRLPVSDAPATGRAARLRRRSGPVVSGWRRDRVAERLELADGGFLMAADGCPCLARFPVAQRVEEHSSPTSPPVVEQLLSIEEEEQLVDRGSEAPPPTGKWISARRGSGRPAVP